jgi:hypothetical protein
MKVIRNTYPRHPQANMAEPGDEVEWELCRGAYRLVRKSDRKSVFCSAPVDANGLLRSNKKQPVLIGIIAQVKSKGWVLEIE